MFAFAAAFGELGETLHGEAQRREGDGRLLSLVWSPSLAVLGLE